MSITGQTCLEGHVTGMREPWQAEALQKRLPAGATLISACWQAVAGRALRMSPDDVESLAQDEVRSRLPAARHLVMSLRVEDLDPERESELVLLAKATDGGAIVVGVAYELQASARAQGQSCPECGSRRLQVPEVVVAEEVMTVENGTAVFQCSDCGSAWDA